MTESLVEIVFRAPAGWREIAAERLSDIAPAGFRCDDVDDDTIELGVYVEHADAAVAEERIAARIEEAFELRVRRVPVPDDFATAWRAFHQPVTIGKLWVGPPWSTPPQHALSITVDPGSGFGTGAHPTTRTMIELLQAQPPSSVLDIGCGSGVLSIVAAKLGFAPITAVDNDPLALASAADNIAANNCRNVRLVRLDARSDRLPAAELVLANLILDPLVAVAPRLRGRRRVLASGVLRSQVDTVEAAFASAEFVLTEQRVRDGWVSLVFENSNPPQQLPGGAIW